MAVTVTQDRTPTEMMTRMGAGWCLNGSKWPQISPLPYLLHADNTGFSEEATTKEAVRHSKGSLNIPHKGLANTSMVHKASHNIINKPLRRKCFVALFSVLCIEKNISR